MLAEPQACAHGGKGARMRRIMLGAAILPALLLIALGGCRMPLCPAGGDPAVVIDKPPLPPTPSVPSYGEVIIFGWHAATDTRVKAVRWFCSEIVDETGTYNPTFDMVADLNAHPERYENKWSAWIPYISPMGRTTTIGDDEELRLLKAHLFAVQAMDYCGNKTKVFSRTTNARQFIVSFVAGPLLTVSEPWLGSHLFLGMNAPAVHCEIPAGLALKFSWSAGASLYGGELTGYRFGWDIVDIDDPQEWAVGFSLEHTSAPPRSFSSGVHTFFVEAMDHMGKISLGRIEIAVLP